MEKGVQFLMKKNKITVIEGEARLEKGSAAPKVIVKGKDGKDAPYDAKHVILATGARAREIPAAGLKADGKRIWTYRDAMTPPSVAGDRCSCSAQAPSASSSRASTPRSA